MTRRPAAPGGIRLAAFLQWVAPCPAYQQSRLLRLDLSSPQPTLLLESAAPIFVDVAWPTPTQLRLTDTGGQTWAYDLATNALTRAP